MKKIHVIGIILLFIGICANTSLGTIVERVSNNPILNGNTLYVGGSGEGNYTSIQDAIDDASEGYTVFVYSGTYYENVKIRKNNITLIGENKDTTIIDGQNKSGYDTVEVRADYVNISDFTIQHCGNYGGDAGIEIFNNYCTIKDNIITLNEDNGISLYCSNGNTISENIISQNQGDWYHGVSLDSSDDNIFVDNNIYDNGYGFSIHHSNNNTIKSNLIHDNYNEEGHFGCGIWLESCNYNVISFNNISDNSGRGIDLYDCHYNNINKNAIIGNGWGTLPYTVGADGICLRVRSKNNLIKRNFIKDNIRDGISIHDASDNLIIENIIKANDRRGIEYSGSGTQNNIIYHNNFFNNPTNGYDAGSNIWDNSYPSGGNYWDDYTGEDNDGDGIGDTPYSIPGGYNEDRYPLMDPWIVKHPVADFIIFNDSEVGFVSFDGSFSYDLDGEIISYEWDFGDGATGNGMFVVHQYCDCGTFNITLTVTDDDGLKDSLTKIIEVWLANIPPPDIEIDGPSSGKVGIEYNYTFYPIFPESIIIYIWIDWGDGNSTGWIGPYSSDEITILNHSWSEKGTYIIQAKSKDLCREGGFSEPLEVTIPRIRATSYLWYEWFLERFPMLERLLTFLLL